MYEYALLGGCMNLEVEHKYIHISSNLLSLRTTSHEKFSIYKSKWKKLIK